MKRLPIFLTLLLVFALALSACATAAQEDDDPGLVVTGTVEAAPGLEVTEQLEPTTAIEATESPVITVEPEVTEPLVVTAEPTIAATEETVATPDAAATEAAAATAEPIAAEAINPNLASNLFGYNVVDANGQAVGEIESLVLDRASGQIAYVLMDANDELNEAEGLVAVPWSAFEATTADDGTRTFVYNVDSELLASAPAIELNDEFDFADPTWDDEVANYWSSQVAVLPSTGDAPAEGTAAGMIRLTDVTDLQLLDANGDDVGDVEDLILDPVAGAIQYVIWAAGGFLDIGEELIPVPYGNLTWDAEDENTLVISADREALETAPRLSNMEALPDTTEPGWDEAIQQFWADLQS